MAPKRTFTPEIVRRWLNVGPLASIVGAALLLSGCAVGPNYVKPTVNVKDSWAAKGAPLTPQPAADAAWWKTFNDPALEQLIQSAYKQNLPLQVAGLRIMEARAELGYAVGKKYPQLQQAFASASGISLSDNVANNQDFDRNFGDYQIGFDVAWEADFWKKFGRGVKAQQAAYLSSVADYQSAFVSLTAEVARTYAVIRTFEVLIDQARRNVAVQDEALRIADARFRNGATSELDVAQARTLAENTRASIPQLEMSLAQSQNALATLLGQPTGSVQSLLQGPPAIPATPTQVAVSVPAEMLRRRPDIRSAELVAMAQSERIGIAKADMYPRFVLAGTVGLQSTSGGSGVNLLDPGSFFAAFGPRLYWPFFNYGRIKNRVRVEDARFEQLLVTYQNAVLKAQQEVEDGMIGFLKAQEAASSQDNAATAARRAVELAFLQYREGEVDFQRVLDTERVQLQEENSLARLRSSIATNLISLYKALGGGWEMTVGQPFVTDAAKKEMQDRTDWGDYFSSEPETSKESAPQKAPASPDR